MTARPASWVPCGRSRGVPRSLGVSLLQGPAGRGSPAAVSHSPGPPPHPTGTFTWTTAPSLSPLTRIATEVRVSLSCGEVRPRITSHAREKIADCQGGAARGRRPVRQAGWMRAHSVPCRLCSWFPTASSPGMLPGPGFSLLN